MKGRSVGFAICAVGLAVIALRHFTPSGSRDIAKQNSGDRAEPDKAIRRVSAHLQPSADDSPMESEPAPRALETPLLYDAETAKTNSVYLARIKKHLQLKYYYSSPAKETPECEKIREILAQRGLGLDAVPDAYNAAWDYHSEKQAYEAVATNDSRKDIVLQMIRDNAITRFKHKYGIADSSFYETLFALQPRLFFGRYNVSIEPGEPLLE